MEKTSSLKKVPLKTLGGLDPTKTSLFVVATTVRKRLLQETPLWRQFKAVTNHFPQVGGNQTQEASGVVFDPTQGDEDVETAPPNDSFQLLFLPQSTSGRSPLFFQKRLAHKQMFKQRVKHYHQWLRSSIHLKTKFSQSPTDLIRLQGPSKRTSSDLLYPVSSVKERNRKGGKCKISRVLQSPVSCTQA